MKSGIDVSFAQRGLDLKAAKQQGAEFVIIRAGIAQRMDTEFAQHVENAEKTGLPYGFYWYSKAMDKDEAKEEAKSCLRAIAGLSPIYPVFYDMEEQEQIYALTSKERTDIIVGFCEAVKAAGYTAGVYLNPAWLEAYVDKNRLVGKYEVWLAHWTGSPDILSSYDYGQVMWQWGTLKIGGMKVDGNICYKDYEGDKSKEEEKKNDEKDKADPGAVLRKGDEVELNKAALYVSSTAKSRSAAVSGQYWICSDGIINARIRITRPKGNSVCTGWVNISDCRRAEKRKSVKEIAQEVVKGLWGNGGERKKRLEAAGYDYNEVQKVVNGLI